MLGAPFKYGIADWGRLGAEEGIRTLDLLLGKEMLYH